MGGEGPPAGVSGSFPFSIPWACTIWGNREETKTKMKPNMQQLGRAGHQAASEPSVPACLSSGQVAWKFIHQWQGTSVS